MTTRQEIEEAVTEWGDTDRILLPQWLRSPSTNEGREFDLAMAVFLHSTYPEVTPVYDEEDRLVAWRGIRLR